jgi:PPOX class probable F420-dependent enzyme
MSRTGAERIDTTTPQGARARERLERDRVAWLTTVAPDGTPQASPVWFLWDRDEILVYSLASPRVRNLATHPEVSLNLDGNGLGGDIVIIEGVAAADDDAPPADENERYLEKYRSVLNEYGWTPQWFAERYEVPIRIRPTRYRYW